MHLHYIQSSVSSDMWDSCSHSCMQICSQTHVGMFWKEKAGCRNVNTWLRNNKGNAASGLQGTHNKCFMSYLLMQQLQTLNEPEGTHKECAFSLKPSAAMYVTTAALYIIRLIFIVSLFFFYFITCQKYFWTTSKQLVKVNMWNRWKWFFNIHVYSE